MKQAPEDTKKESKKEETSVKKKAKEPVIAEMD